MMLTENHHHTITSLSSSLCYQDLTPVLGNNHLIWWYTKIQGIYDISCSQVFYFKVSRVLFYIKSVNYINLREYHNAEMVIIPATPYLHNTANYLLANCVDKTLFLSFHVQVCSCFFFNNKNLFWFTHKPWLLF